ncbi:organic hydroperoxide resistance protein [Algiphilus sp.]|uniref:organic hydroperoxide resistance protein n=1 Tax=Algiphilus sp. TaxID=1872431 RepID=UPI0032EF8A68
MNIVYTTQVTASGGRDGHAKSDDGLLDLPLSMPGNMGGAGKAATNPEQLFGAGYASCFENAVLHVAKQGGHKLGKTEVTSEVSLGINDDGSFGLEVTLNVTVEGVEGDALNAIVKEADRLCPYSNAVRGNVPVQINIL